MTDNRFLSKSAIVFVHRHSTAPRPIVGPLERGCELEFGPNLVPSAVRGSSVSDENRNVNSTTAQALADLARQNLVSAELVWRKKV
jgi:hypothetical protein